MLRLLLLEHLLYNLLPILYFFHYLKSVISYTRIFHTNILFDFVHIFLLYNDQYFVLDYFLLILIFFQLSNVISGISYLILYISNSFIKIFNTFLAISGIICLSNGALLGKVICTFL